MTQPAIEPSPRFVEVQHFPWWASLLVLGSATLVLALWVSGAGTRRLPGWAAAAIAIALLGAFALLFRMRTEVSADAVEVRFGWLGIVRFRVPVEQIDGCRPVTYRPLRDFGGWGIRFASRGRRAWSARGDRGAEIAAAGRTILVGSARPERLCEAIRAARGGAPTGRG